MYKNCKLTLLTVLFLGITAGLVAHNLYGDWKAKQTNDFADYRASIQQRWTVYRQSSDRTWVYYDHTGSACTAVDFGGGSVTVSVLLDRSHPARDNAHNPELEQAVERVLKEPDADGKPLLAGLIQVDQRIYQGGDVRGKAKALTAQPQVSTLKGTDGKTRTELTVTIDMVPNHVDVRRDRYRELMEPICRDNHIPVALALAIVYRESLFNPRAYNPKTKAAGLMQIVPSASGRFMNKRLHGIDAEPDSTTLFDARENLRFGIGYLGYLSNEVFQAIDHEDVRMRCVIAGYRFGWGAVIRSHDDFLHVVDSWPGEKLGRHLRSTFSAPMQIKYLDDIDQLVDQYGGY